MFWGGLLGLLCYAWWWLRRQAPPRHPTRPFAPVPPWPCDADGVWWRGPVRCWAGSEPLGTGQLACRFDGCWWQGADQTWWFEWDAVLSITIEPRGGVIRIDTTGTPPLRVVGPDPWRWAVTADQFLDATEDE